MGTVTENLALEAERLRNEIRSAKGEKKKDKDRLQQLIDSVRTNQAAVHQIGVDLGNIYNVLPKLPPPAAGNYVVMADTPSYYAPGTYVGFPDINAIISNLASILRYLERIQPQGKVWSHSQPPTGDSDEVIFHYLRHIRIYELWTKYGAQPKYNPRQTAQDHEHLIFQFEVDLIFQQFNIILKPNNLVPSPSGAADDDSLMEQYTAGIFGFFA